MLGGRYVSRGIPRMLLSVYCAVVIEVTNKLLEGK